MRYLRLLLLGMLLCTTGCAALGLQPATNATDTIAYAYSGVTSAYTQLTQLASTGAISRPVAQKAYTAITAVKTALDTAASATGSSAPIAVTVITSATTTLATIAAYLACNQQTPGSTICQL